MNARCWLLALAPLLVSCVPASGQLLPSLWTRGRVTRIIDGDTYEVLLNSQKKRVRLLHVDCPELTQPFGRQAADSVKRLLLARVVLVRLAGTDLYGRSLAHIRLPRDPVLGVTPPALALDSLLVRRGWAWATCGASEVSCGPRATLQVSAVTARRGMWKCVNDSLVLGGPPVPPVLWRRFDRKSKRLYYYGCTW